MEYIIETKGVTKIYESFTLNSIDIKIPYGKVVGLIGENGAGKTTFISILLNQLHRNEGLVKLFGMDNIKQDIECKKLIGFVVDECCFHNCLNAHNINRIMP
ncbi:ATP-binding cassette domain-containing protein, partial [Aminipila sp.]|uniref:ATP-binding cassette domain-containing protein n=1 Tax=Aminipila sp. TaxID=2060095 RepID=UPI00289D90ED